MTVFVVVVYFFSFVFFIFLNVIVCKGWIQAGQEWAGLGHACLKFQQGKFDPVLPVFC